MRKRDAMLGHVSPVISVENVSDGRLSDATQVCKNSCRSITRFANRSNLRLSQARVGVTLSAKRSAAFVPVLDIVSVRADSKVCGVNTRGIVTARTRMQHLHSGRNWTVFLLPREAMGVDGTTANFKSSVTITIKRSCPDMTGSSRIDASGKSFAGGSLLTHIRTADGTKTCLADVNTRSFGQKANAARLTISRDSGMVRLHRNCLLQRDEDGAVSGVVPATARRFRFSHFTINTPKGAC